MGHKDLRDCVPEGERKNARKKRVADARPARGRKIEPGKKQTYETAQKTQRGRGKGSGGIREESKELVWKKRGTGTPWGDVGASSINE